MPSRHAGLSPGFSPSFHLQIPAAEGLRRSIMNRSVVSPETDMAPAGPWLTHPLRGLIARFGMAFLIQILEATLLITLLALALPLALLQVYDRILPNHAVGTLLVLGIAVT